MLFPQSDRWIEEDLWGCEHEHRAARGTPSNSATRFSDSDASSFECAL